jgi:EpsI family protein
MTRGDTRVADDRVWQLNEQGRTETSVDGRRVGVTSSQLVSGPYRRLVWSFYLVDGQIAAGLLKAKLLQARAVLLRHASVGAFVAISASEDDPDRQAAAALARFLQANRQLLGDRYAPRPGTTTGRAGAPG